MLDSRPRFHAIAALTIALAATLSGCASNGITADGDATAPARAITQSAPTPDYSVHYWSALRACLQTGRSEWECKSGEDRFVRDALAIEAALSVQRQQRRQAFRDRADLELEPTDPTSMNDAADRTQSIVVQSQPLSLSPPLSLDDSFDVFTFEDLTHDTTQ
ncbi:MAG: hypothetical protein AAFX75_16745 [Pseudomonadota bacterium]